MTHEYTRRTYQLGILSHTEQAFGLSDRRQRLFFFPVRTKLLDLIAYEMHLEIAV